MPDTFTQTATRGWGKRLLGSIGGVLIGLLLIVGGFALLYWNEGRVDLSSIAARAMVIPGDTISQDASTQGMLVSVTGMVKGDEAVTDGLFLSPGNYLALERVVEMYAWVEERDDKSEKNVGGSETTTTTYSYEKAWTDDPQVGSTFEYPEGHENPSLPITGVTHHVESLTVGAYMVDGTVELPSPDDLALSDEILSLSSGAERVNEEYLFMGTGTLANPNLGDVRVSYRALQDRFTGTVIGKRDGDAITSYRDKDGNEVFRLFTGSHDEAVATLHEEYVIMTWLLRAAGFLMLWVGLTLMIGPLATLLDVLPFLGTGARFLAAVVTFPIALVLAVVAILVSMILHSLIAVIIVGVLAFIGILIFLRSRRKPKDDNLHSPGGTL